MTVGQAPTPFTADGDPDQELAGVPRWAIAWRTFVGVLAFAAVAASAGGATYGFLHSLDPAFGDEEPLGVAGWLVFGGLMGAVFSLWIAVPVAMLCTAGLVVAIRPGASGGRYRSRVGLVIGVLRATSILVAIGMWVAFEPEVEMAWGLAVSLAVAQVLLSVLRRSLLGLPAAFDARALRPGDGPDALAP